MRALRYRGAPVEVQNYIDDTGVQVADVVVGFRHLLEPRSRRPCSSIADTHALRLLLLGPLRARHRVVRRRQGSASRSAPQTLHDIEHGVDPTAAIGAFVAERIVRAHLVTMARLGIDYQLLTWEGDILRLQFWARAFELLKQSGSVFLQPEGRLAGCWVMRIEEDGDAAVEATAGSRLATTRRRRPTATARATPKPSCARANSARR